MAPDGRPWPRVTVVTPSFNQAAFLEQTIRSVLLQGYPNLEYFVVDGGSTDGSADVLRRYAPWISRQVSEPDAGQSDAINKGLSWATGEWASWLNSDDWLAPDALASLADRATGDGQRPDVVYGVAHFTDADGTVGRPYATGPFDLRRLLAHNFIGQPATFFRRDLIDRHGPLRTSLRFILDYELWVRWALAGARFAYDPRIVAYYRMHEASKSATLVRTNQRETVALLEELRRDGRLPADMADTVPTRVRAFADWNYARGDLPEFRRNVHRYVARYRRTPSVRLARQYAMSFLGMAVLGRLRAARHAQ